MVSTTTQGSCKIGGGDLQGEISTSTFPVLFLFPAGLLLCRKSLPGTALECLVLPGLHLGDQVDSIGQTMARVCALPHPCDSTRKGGALFPLPPLEPPRLPGGPTVLALYKA